MKYWILTTPMDNGYQQEFYAGSLASFILKYHRVILFAVEVSKDEYIELVGEFTKSEAPR